MVAGIVLLNASSITLHAAPSIEACPPDSILSDNTCICNMDSCVKPPCLSDLEIVTSGDEKPGSCCPLYSCQGCKNESLINGKCPCAPGAVINERGICECVEKELHLVNGECVCNPQQCELPHVCGKKHVLTTIEDGCCRKTRCLPCPDDSESTNLDSDSIEDHCVCLPCKNYCDHNKTIVVKKKGTNFPGNCCDLYECKLLDKTEKNCVVGDIIYADGETWSTADKQECRCQNALSLCTTRDDTKNCIYDGIMKQHNTTWRTDNDCTECTCLNGDINCISHFCETKEAKIKESTPTSCTRNDNIYEHLKIWIDERDNCTVCQCFNGVEQCNSTNCAIKETPEVHECRPLSDCNKQCPNGFRLNRRGCEICKCNPTRVGQELLSKYNISMNDLIHILNDYVREKIDSEETNTTSTSTTTTTTPPSILTILKNDEGILDKSASDTTIKPTCFSENDNSSWIVPVAVIVIVVIAITTVYICYKSKRRQSMDITPFRGKYHTVNLMDNNNTIKKSSIGY